MSKDILDVDPDVSLELDEDKGAAEVKPAAFNLLEGNEYIEKQEDGSYKVKLIYPVKVADQTIKHLTFEKFRPAEIAAVGEFFTRSENGFEPKLLGLLKLIKLRTGFNKSQMELIEQEDIDNFFLVFLVFTYPRLGGNV